MSIVTLFHYSNKIIQSKPLLSVLLEIKNGRLKREVGNLRKNFNEYSNRNYEVQKQAIPMIGVSGHFKETDHQLIMVSYSGCQLLEIGYLSEKEKLRVKALLREDAHCFGFFDSAAGLGLQILVQTDNTRFYHKEAFWQVRQYYERLTKVHRFSTHGEALDYKCSMSYDELAYINLKVAPFQTQLHGEYRTS